ncbi:hypothetical protein ILYODFUR_017436, partial [Ilyodon furcidens]
QEISEEKACREALRKKITVPYFHPENLPIYQSLLQGPIPNTGSRSQDPALTTKPDSAETVVKHVSHKTPPPPSNPTASQPESQAEESERMPERRHANLTTQSAGESSLRSSCRQYKSVQVDVTGKLRRTKVRLPTCLLATKPCSVPNQHFLSVEEPVRRKCRTASLANLSAVLRGFQLIPSSVDFGMQLEGTYSTVTVLMKNVGVDLCRYTH